MTSRLAEIVIKRLVDRSEVPVERRRTVTGAAEVVVPPSAVDAIVGGRIRLGRPSSVT